MAVCILYTMKNDGFHGIIYSVDKETRFFDNNSPSHDSRGDRHYW